MLRVALLDDHPAVLTGLRRLRDSERDLTVAAVASHPAELVRELDGLSRRAEHHSELRG
jgi:DNA-binding NarL/FixJ family response regulator